jgi:hypothetical protein
MRSFSFIALLFCSLFLMSATLSAADYSHDMSAYIKMAGEAQAFVTAGKMSEAATKAKEFEKAYDVGTKDFKKADKKGWTIIDKQMDVALAACEGTDAAKATAELTKWTEQLTAESKKAPAK